MEQKSKIRVVISFVVFMALVVVLSSVSGRLWGEKPEKVLIRPELVFQREMTVSEFGKTNQLPDKANY